MRSVQRYRIVQIAIPGPSPTLAYNFESSPHEQYKKNAFAICEYFNKTRALDGAQLTLKHAPKTMVIHKIASRLAQKLYSVHGIRTPEINAAPVLWRVVRSLGGNRKLAISLLLDTMALTSKSKSVHDDQKTCPRTVVTINSSSFTCVKHQAREEEGSREP